MCMVCQYISMRARCWMGDSDVNVCKGKVVFIYIVFMCGFEVRNIAVPL